MPKWSLVLLHIYSVGGKKKKKKLQTGSLFTHFISGHSLHFSSLKNYAQYYTRSLYIYY